MKNLTLAYGENEIIKNLNLNLHHGEFLVVVGENGVGKTTLVRSLLGQLKPKAGEIEKTDNLRIGYVPQFRNLDSEYPLSIRDFVALNLPIRSFPWLSKHEKTMVDQVLKKTNLTSIENRLLGKASGGEKQRAYLAQALLRSPQLLVLDESTASLDNEMKYELLDLVNSERQAGLTVLFVTHDLDLAQRYGSNYLFLYHGGYQKGPIDQLPMDQLTEVAK